MGTRQRERERWELTHSTCRDTLEEPYQARTSGQNTRIMKPKCGKRGGEGQECVSSDAWHYPPALSQSTLLEYITNAIRKPLLN